jgi:hypothetical protein
MAEWGSFGFAEHARQAAASVIAFVRSFIG